jgi:phage-related protein
VARYSVEFYETDAGRSPPEDFLNNLKRKLPKAWTKCMRYVELLTEHGWDLVTKLQYAEKVEDHLWTLRPEFSNVEYRLFFTWDSKARAFVILDGIAKKTQKLTERDKKRARARMKEVLNG